MTNEPYDVYQRPEDLDEYQALAASTAIYPRVYTERQVIELVGYLSTNIEELHAVDAPRLMEAVIKGLDKIETPFNRLVYPVLGLVGEAGEISNKLKKVARDNNGEWEPEFTQDYEKEVGDVLWYVAAIATGLKSKLSKIGSANISKLLSRKSRGVLSGSGDNR